MVARHGGAVPDDLDALRALPGIGPYTARAVLAFAYERDVAVVDTNIARVLARVDGGAADAPAGPERSPTTWCRRATGGRGTRRSWTSVPPCAGRRRDAPTAR